MAVTVSELIKYLEMQPQDLPVAYCMCSENNLLELDEIKIKDLCVPRADGWVPNFRPDMPTQKYLLFPGN